MIHACMLGKLSALFSFLLAELWFDVLQKHIIHAVYTKSLHRLQKKLGESLLNASLPRDTEKRFWLCESTFALKIHSQQETGILHLYVTDFHFLMGGFILKIKRKCVRWLASWGMVFGRCLLSSLAPSVSAADSWAGLDAVTCPCQSSQSWWTHLAIVSFYHLFKQTLYRPRTIWNIHEHREKTWCFCSGFMPAVPALFCCRLTVADFRRDLVTFHVRPILPLSMLSVRSPVSSCLEQQLPTAVPEPARWASEKALPALPALLPHIYHVPLRKQRQQPSHKSHFQTAKKRTPWERGSLCLEQWWNQPEGMLLRNSSQDVWHSQLAAQIRFGSGGDSDVSSSHWQQQRHMMMTETSIDLMS